MTAEQFRARVLSLIQGWLQNREVQQSTIAVQVLNNLAGDIQLINLTKQEKQT